MSLSFSCQYILPLNQAPQRKPPLTFPTDEKESSIHCNQSGGEGKILRLLSRFFLKVYQYNIRPQKNIKVKNWKGIFFHRSHIFNLTDEEVYIIYLNISCYNSNKKITNGKLYFLKHQLEKDKKLSIRT